MSEAKKTYLYVNTAPRAYVNKETGTQFWLVLIGIAKETLLAKGVTEAQARNLKVEMQIFPDKVDVYTKAYTLAKAAGLKLVVKCDEFTLTEVKPNNYVANNVAVNGFKASCWAIAGTMDVLGSTLSISDELRKLLEENGEDDGDILS